LQKASISREPASWVSFIPLNRCRAEGETTSSGTNDRSWITKVHPGDGLLVRGCERGMNGCRTPQTSLLLNPTSSKVSLRSSKTCTTSSWIHLYFTGIYLDFARRTEKSRRLGPTSGGKSYRLPFSSVPRKLPGAKVEPFPIFRPENAGKKKPEGFKWEAHKENGSSTLDLEGDGERGEELTAGVRSETNN